jgi:membrane protein DedA with SNARE-associated domain
VTACILAAPMEFLHELTGAEAYLLLCFLLFVEEVGVPLPMLPGDVLLLAGGYLAAIGVVHISVFLIAAYLAVAAGAVVCHAVSTRLARPAVLRWGRFVGLTEHRVVIAERWLHRNGTPAVAVARVLPGTRITMSMAAGALRLPRRDFVLGVIPSTAVFVGLFTIIGFVLGDRVTPLLPWYDRIAVGLATVAVIGGTIFWAVRRRVRRSRGDARPQEAMVV